MDARAYRRHQKPLGACRPANGGPRCAEGAPRFSCEAGVSKWLEKAFPLSSNVAEPLEPLRYLRSPGASFLRRDEEGRGGNRGGRQPVPREPLPILRM